MNDEQMKAHAEELLRGLPPSVQYALMAAAAASLALPPPPPLAILPLPPLPLPPTPPSAGPTPAPFLMTSAHGAPPASGEQLQRSHARPLPDAAARASASAFAAYSPPSSSQQQQQQQQQQQPEQPHGGPPDHHVFHGTKAPQSACGICGATTTGGGCWRRLWLLAQPPGAWLCGCNRCGLRFRHGKIGPPKTGPLAPAVGWRNAPPPPRMRPAAQQQQYQQPQYQQHQQSSSFGYGSFGVGDDEADHYHDHEHDHDHDHEAEGGSSAWPECEDEAETAAWTLVGISGATMAAHE